MGAIRKRSGSYRAEVFRRGVRESKTFRTERQAKDWIATREDEIDRGINAPVPQSLMSAIDRRLRDETLSKWDRLRLAAFRAESWAALPIKDVTTDVLAGWRDDRLKKVQSGTLLRELTVLRALLEIARKEWKWIDVNPVRDLAKPKPPPARKVTITDDERDEIVKRLGFTGNIETIQHEAAVALLIALETGMRAGEILALTPAHIRDNVAVLDTSKTGEGREVPLSKRAVELFGMMCQRKLIRRINNIDGRIFHISSASLDVTFRRARDKEPAMRRFHFHDARATAITRLSKTLDPLELARVVGHRDLKSLLTYYRPSAASIAERLG